MRAEFTTTGDDLVYRLVDVDPRYDDVLRQCFWQQDDSGWWRTYPRSARHLDQARARFADHAEEMFDQLGYFAPVPWPEALEAFAAKADEAGLFWWLVGSCAACVRGVPLDPHDVDVMIDGADADRFADVFADWLVEPIVDTGGWLTRDFGVLFHHARIDIASDPAASLDDPTPADCGPFARDHLETVEYRGHQIKVPPLALQLDVNRRRGRHERAALIEEALEG